MAKSSDKVKAILLSQLRNELTESAIYERLSKMEKDSGNRGILERISADEMSHAKLIAAIVSENVKPCSFKIHWTVFCARVLGLTFVLRLMEKGEHNAGGTYRTIIDAYPQLSLIAEDEDRHEAELIGMLNDERLNNMGSIVLGLNDALVELTGALAGFTFALGSPAKIAKLGLITGFAAAMSMAASAFLSARADAQAGGEKSSEGEGNGALRSALYTGIAYVVTVFLLTAPYALLPSATVALAVMLLVALSIIAFFNFYLSVARDVSFKRGFFVMAGISTFVALVSYGFGYLLR
ncbi:MAG: VIT1/CCC1 transporter family protein [Kiritimatiellae bacterium]|jgi:VIT1/CCC1 family predicted Fe2+/Mn2+ transporter|nr:VIT1/CCC1 transporter family protein [Kiritimatiellia bacterium]